MDEGDSRGRAFGCLRLLLAAMVILSHTPELADGDRHREPLTRLFGSLSCGELAVDGFFVISGYLITASYLSTASWPSFLLKRLARIYPAYLLASVLCLLVVAPLAGGRLPEGVAGLGQALARALLLLPPQAAGVFIGTHYPVLDGAAWTLAYEFKCYLLVMVLGWLGLLRRRWPILALGGLLLGAAMHWRPAYYPDHAVPGLLAAAATAVPPLQLWPALLGEASQWWRLLGMYLTGVCLYQWRARIRCSVGAAWLAMALLGLALAAGPLATGLVALPLAWLLLAGATLAEGHWPGRINRRRDSSYGLYIYAWPVQKLLCWWLPGLGLWPGGGLTLLLSLLLGGLSWHCLEQPVLRAVRARRPGAGMP